MLWKRLQIGQANKTDNSYKASEKTDTLQTGRARSLKSKITIFRSFLVQATIDDNYRETFDQRLLLCFLRGKNKQKTYITYLQVKESPLFLLHLFAHCSVVFNSFVFTSSVLFTLMSINSPVFLKS